jgi:hypothetical protein
LCYRYALQALPSGQPHAQLTELTGLKGAIGQRCIVMGVISSSEEGGSCIEDEGAVVPLDLSNAKTTGGLITGEKMVIFLRLSILRQLH